MRYYNHLSENGSRPMTDLLRQEIATAADTIVVKVGTRVLTHEDGTLDESRIARLGEEICQILDTGRHVVLVSSGAVGAGMSQLGLNGARRTSRAYRPWRQWGKRV